MDFGFTITAPRAIELDSIAPGPLESVVRREPSLRLCIGCGSCTATCTASQFIPLSLRQMNHMLRRGQYDYVREQLTKCMLCGKCRMTCPRGVNTRAVIRAMLDIL